MATPYPGLMEFRDLKFGNLLSNAPAKKISIMWANSGEKDPVCGRRFVSFFGKSMFKVRKAGFFFLG